MRLPIAREGLPFIGVPLAAAAAAALFGSWPLAVGAAVLALGMAGFFRDPERTIAGTDTSVVSPADGRIVRLAETDHDTVELSIFLSPLDVHINRSPVTGRLVEAEHRPGSFRPAYKHEASEHNEQTRLVIVGPCGVVRMRQIVGMLARRIVLWKSAGSSVERGERIGLMKFGSRVDLELPRPMMLKVAEGQRVRAGETVLAERGQNHDD